MVVRSGGRVVVIGSANLDVVVRVQRLPAAGETVLGHQLEEVAGGKGLNQAIAAALRGPCTFVGTVGDDEAGRILVDRLQRAGVDTTWVARVPGPTGRALIEVDAAGENRIVVAPLANARLEADTVRNALDQLAPAVVLAQLEVPLAAVSAAAAWAAANGARFVLNASPVAVLPPDVLRCCDPLVVNRVEASAMLGDDPAASAPDDGVGALADRLAGQVTSVVVTDGPRGAHVGTAERIRVIPAEPVTPVDTTGAGDAFAGTLAGALANGETLPSATGCANAAAARVIQLPRAQR